MGAHLAIDVREDAIYWARAKAGRNGLALVDCGALARNPDTALDEQLGELAGRKHPWRAHIEVSLSSPSLVHQREELPKLSRGDFERIAQRRAPEVVAEIEGESCFAFARADRGEGPMWLSAAPLGVARAEIERWKDRGLEVDRLSSRHLALGNLTKLLDLSIDELVIILDLEPECGTCVVADRFGWIFSREVPLRFMGDRRHHAVRDVMASIGTDEDDLPSGLELAGEEPGDDAPRDPLEAVAEQTERLATELRRTFQYVAGQLGLGDVARVHLTGESRELGDLALGLSHALGVTVAPLHESVAEPGCGDLATRGSVALGLALAPSRSTGNLLPTDLRRNKSVASARRRLALGLAAALLSIGAVAFLLDLGARSAQHQIESLQARWTDEAPQRELIEGSRQARLRSAALAQTLAEIDVAQPPWVALFEGLARFAPERAFVERLEIERADGQWKVALVVGATGATVADAAQAVSKFAQAASASPLIAVRSTEREHVERLGGEENAHATIRYRIDGELARVVGASGPTSPSKRGDHG